MKYLFILNESPYGNEKPYNALRLAMTLQKEHQAEVTFFFMGDSVVAAMKNQKTPDGFYNLERMIRSILLKKGTVLMCGTCMEARGMSEESLIAGAQKSTMLKLAEVTDASDKVLVF